VSKNEAKKKKIERKKEDRKIGKWQRRKKRGRIRMN
jgi:hypothetical protein